VRAVARSERVNALEGQDVHKGPAEHAGAPGGQKLSDWEVGGIDSAPEIDALVLR
jgi:hypothetical protein